MKRFNFPLLAAMLGLVVVFASCGMTQPGYGDEGYSERPVRSRQIYSDPYYSNAPTIVRDPYTGRYYEVRPVSPYGYDAYSTPYGVYGDSRYYGRSSSRGYSNNRARNYGTNVPRTSQQTQTQEQPRSSSETINKARGIIRKDQ